MDIFTAIKKAKVGQKVKRKNPSTVSFVMEDGAVVKVGRKDYEAQDWVLVVPKKAVKVEGTVEGKSPVSVNSFKHGGKNYTVKVYA